MRRVGARLARLLARAGPPEATLPDLVSAVCAHVGAAVVAAAFEDAATAEALARLAGYVAERAASVPADCQPHWRARPARRVLEHLAATNDPQLRALVARAAEAARQAPAWPRLDPWSPQFDPDHASLRAALRLTFSPSTCHALGVAEPTTQEDP